jgi:hypothetical protein
MRICASFLKRKFLTSIWHGAALSSQAHSWSQLPAYIELEIVKAAAKSLN